MRLQLSARFSATLPHTRSHSACRWSYFTTSTAVIIFICPAVAGNATYHTSLGDRAFAVAGPRAWNTLPDFITDCSSSRTFKQYLKTYLFSLSFWAHNSTLFYDCVKRPSIVACAAYDALKLSFLHYITSAGGWAREQSAIRSHSRHVWLCTADRAVIISKLLYASAAWYDSFLPRDARSASTVLLS